jgi:putative heme-binding domain-containing protein
MRSLSLISLLVVVTPASAQRDARVPDPDPELERKTFVLPDGFEVNLFAADPMLAKPIQMNFDPQGRLWVVSSEVYPQIKPGQVVNDRVLILEDTDGDGKADKTTVFADGLLIPTGVAPGDGGAYVADSTDLVHFSDPDPKTGKARKKRIVLSGFGTEDTHHIIHTFRWGPDGMLYFNQSVYIHSHIETPHGVRHLNAGGVWQFRPETVELGVFARGFWNPWGTQFDRWGQTFATDGANGEGINILMPGAAYPAAKWDGRILNGLNPGSPKHCGLEVLSGRHLPEEYQGNLITNDFRGHRVCRFVLREDGSGYQSQEKQELIKSAHPAFRPVDVAMGPDGAIYVADWYNPIIQHGEVDFRDPRRDHTHGRIWRITAKGRPLVERPMLVGAPVRELLDRLRDPEDWTRLQAKRVLKERGAKEVLPILKEWLAKLDPKGPDFEHHRLEALWVYQSLDVVEPKLLDKVLNSKDHRARAAACQVAAAWAGRGPTSGLHARLDLKKMEAFGTTTKDVTAVFEAVGYRVEAGPAEPSDRAASLILTPAARDGSGVPRPDELKELKIRNSSGQMVPLRAIVAVDTVESASGLPNPLDLLAARVADDHPQVRLDSVRALAHVPDPKAVVLAAKALDRPVDKWLDYALWLTFRELAPHWLGEVKAGKLDFGGDPRHLVFALQAAGSGDVVKPLVALLKSGKVSGDREGDAWLMLAQLGGPNELGQVLKYAADSAPPMKDRLLTAVEESVRRRKVGRPPDPQAELLLHLVAENPGITHQASCRLIGLWKVEKYRPLLMELARDRVKLDNRKAAFEGLVLLGGEKSKEFFASLTAPDCSWDTRRLGVIALAGLDPKAAAAPAAEFLASAAASDELAELYAAFVQRKDGTAELAKALAGKKLPADVARVGVRAAKATGQTDPQLIEALTKAGGLTAVKRELKGQELAQFVADVSKLGDPACGEQVFRRAELTCLKCHAIAGAGGQVGPDLSSVGASAQVDYLVESLHDPNAKVKEGFHSLIVTTVDGRTVTGLKVRETPTELVLRDHEDREVVIPTADIDARKDGKSLMPDGLTDTLTRQELLDLTRFLSELGKGAYAATPGKVVRRWQSLQPTRELITLLSRDRLGAITAADATLTWAPAYSLVSGDLPLDAAPSFKGNQAAPPTSVVRFQVEVTTAGKARLAFNDPTGLTVWVDGTPLDPAGDRVADLSAGVHAVTVAVDRSKRSAALRAELDEVPGSPARARVLGGK